MNEIRSLERRSKPGGIVYLQSLIFFASPFWSRMVLFCLSGFPVIFFQPPDALLQNGKLPHYGGRIHPTNTGCTLESLFALVVFDPREQLLHSDPKHLGHANNSSQSKILASGFEVSDECSMQFAIVREFFLRLETALNPNLPDTVSETFKDFFHSPECSGMAIDWSTDVSVASLSVAV